MKGYTGSLCFFTGFNQLITEYSHHVRDSGLPFFTKSFNRPN